MRYRKLLHIFIIATLFMLNSGCSSAIESKETQKIKGKFVFYALRSLKEPWEIYISKNGKITKFKNAVSPLWSNDGKKVACVKDATITIVDTKGNLLNIFPKTKGALGIAWSPDNTKFAYTAREGAYTEFDKLFLYDIETGEKEKLVDYNNEYSITYVLYSPKGDKILFYRSYVNDIKKCGVYIYDLNVSSIKLISAQGGRPAWFPDGKHVLILTNRNEDWSMINSKLGVFMKINIETGEKKILRERTSFIKDIKITKDGKFFYYSKPVSKGGRIIVVSPIDNPELEIPITKPVDLGKGQGYSQDLEPDWYQGE